MKDKQFLFLTRYPPCYLFDQTPGYIKYYFIYLMLYWPQITVSVPPCLVRYCHTHVFHFILIFKKNKYFTLVLMKNITLILSGFLLVWNICTHIYCLAVRILYLVKIGLVINTYNKNHDRKILFTPLYLLIYLFVWQYAPLLST